MVNSKKFLLSKSINDNKLKETAYTGDLNKFTALTKQTVIC